VCVQSGLIAAWECDHFATIRQRSDEVSPKDNQGLSAIWLFLAN
jgi:hypothetical protein